MEKLNATAWGFVTDDPNPVAAIAIRFDGEEITDVSTPIVGVTENFHQFVLTSWAEMGFTGVVITAGTAEIDQLRLWGYQQGYDRAQNVGILSEIEL